MEPTCLQKTYKKSIICFIDIGRQNGHPEASKMEPKLGQGPPKNKPEKEAEKKEN